MGKNRIHDRLVELVFGRLSGNGYTNVMKNRHYEKSQRHEEGEFDILAVRANNEHFSYAVIIEVKSSKHGRSYKRAQEQLQKNCQRVREIYGLQVRCFSFIVYQNKQRLKHGLDRPYYIEWLRGCTKGD